MPKFRLAPTPSGLLHIGNGVNFVLTAALAEAQDAELILRIDDLDSTRVRGEYLNDIERTVLWLFPDQGERLWKEAIYQSQRLAQYDAFLDSLRQNQLVYACTCSRKDIREAQEAAGQNFDINVYPGTCRDRGLDLETEEATWRLRTEEASGDFIVRQRNSRPSYQLASLVDDVDLGITHIVRGKDLTDSSDMQLVLAKAASMIIPEYADFASTQFWHHSLLRDQSGQKLSKSAGSDSMREYRQGDARPADVLAKASTFLGKPGIRNWDELIALAKKSSPFS